MLRLCDPRNALAGLLALTMLLNPERAEAQDQSENLCERPHVEGAPHVVMVLWRGPTTVEQGVQAYLDSRDLTFNFTCLSADRDSSRFSRLIRQAQALEPDLLYTWGTSATLAAVGTYEKDSGAFPTPQIPVLFTMVSYPVQSKVVPDFEGSGRNLTGSSHTVPLVSQLKAMQAYREVTRIGMIFNPREVNSVLNMHEMSALTDEIGIELVAFRVPLIERQSDAQAQTEASADDGYEDAAEGQPDPSALPELIARMAARDVQFLYIGPDNFVGTNQEAIIGEALSHGIPSFTGTELEILDGDALVGLVTPYYNLGLLNGSLIERILVDGEAPEAIPISTLARFTYIVRMNVARRIGVFPPLDILEFARILDGETE